eukprot:6487078-Amphidinium_carterae.3
MRTSVRNVYGGPIVDEDKYFFAGAKVVHGWPTVDKDKYFFAGVRNIYGGPIVNEDKYFFEGVQIVHGWPIVNEDKYFADDAEGQIADGLLGSPFLLTKAHHKVIDDWQELLVTLEAVVHTLAWACFLGSIGANTLAANMLVAIVVGHRSCTLALGAQFVVTSRWLHAKPRVAKTKTTRPQYNPGLAHENHCLFATLARCVKGAPPTPQEVLNFRDATAVLWRSVPTHILEEIARTESLTSEQYIQNIAGSMWGGLQEVLLWTWAFHLSAKASVGDDIHSFGDGAGPHICLEEQHFTLLTSSRHTKWKKLSFALRRHSNLHALLSNKIEVDDNDKGTFYRRYPRGGAPKQLQPVEPLEQEMESGSDTSLDSGPDEPVRKVMVLTPLLVGSPMMVKRALDTAADLLSYVTGFMVRHHFHPHRDCFVVALKYKCFQGCPINVIILESTAAIMVALDIILHVGAEEGLCFTYVSYHVALVEEDYNLPFNRVAFSTAWAMASRVHAIVVLGKDSLLVVTRLQTALANPYSEIGTHTCLLDASRHHIACTYTLQNMIASHYDNEEIEPLPIPVNYLADQHPSVVNWYMNEETRLWAAILVQAPHMGRWRHLARTPREQERFDFANWVNTLNDVRNEGNSQAADDTLRPVLRSDVGANNRIYLMVAPMLNVMAWADYEEAMEVFCGILTVVTGEVISFEVVDDHI